MMADGLGRGSEDRSGSARDTLSSEDELRTRVRMLTQQQRDALRNRLSSTDEAAPTVGVETDAGARRNDPRWSLFFFAADPEDLASSKYELMLDCARFADAEGFEAIWVPERHFDSFGGPYPDPAVLAAAIASTTSRIRIRAGSVVLPLHDPILIAERWGMLDNLSGGRVDISIASGWHPQDFVLAPGAYNTRKEVTLERLHELWKLWAGGAVMRADGTGTPTAVRTFPRPRTNRLGTWLTSSSNIETWLTAARLEVNILTALLEQDLTEVADKVSAYQQAWPSPRTHGFVTLMVHTFVGTDEATVRKIVEPALTRYLRSHVSLFEKVVRAQGLKIDLELVTEDDKSALAGAAFERYFRTHGLFGTPETCVSRVQQFVAAGVDEIACLVDFGVPPDQVRAGLANLVRLRQLSSTTSAT